MVKGILSILVSVVLLLTVAVSVFGTPLFSYAAEAGADPLVTVDNNIVVRTKRIPAVNFYGEVSYAKMQFVFTDSGNIGVDYQGYSYQFELPFADLGRATIATYQNKSQVVRTYTIGKHTVTYIFDFDKYPDRVGLDFEGRLDTKATLDIGILVITGDFGIRGSTAWVGSFDPRTGDIIAGIGFDWGDAVQSATVDQAGGIHKQVRFSINSGQDFKIDPSVVGTSTTAHATERSYQRKAFYANGRHWVFYSDGTNIVWRTSTDGTTWGSSNTVRTGATGAGFSLYFDGIYVHYAYASNSNVYYRRGTPEAGGTITWSAVEQTATTGSLYYPTVCTDSTGYPFISYFSVTTYYIYVTKSSTNDGTWSTQSGFPVIMSNDADCASIVNLGGGKVYCAFTYDSSPTAIYGKEWNGSTWGSQETVMSTGANGCNFWAITAYNGMVGIVYTKFSPYDIGFKERSSGGTWGSETVIRAATTAGSAPTLSVKNDSNDLVCFWSGSPTTNHIFYKTRTSGIWDTNPTDWISETALTTNYQLTAFLTYNSGIIGLVYLTKTSTPYDVKYAFLSFAAPTITTNAASNIGGTSARLNGTIVNDGGGACQVRWGYGLSPQANFENYTYKTDWEGAYTTGQNPYYDATGLALNTPYYFRMQAKNIYGTTTGNEVNFTTTTTVDPPTGLKAYPSGTSVNLSWVKGAGATETVIRFRYDVYPTSYIDGEAVGTTTGNTLIHSDLEPGTTYYYKAWSRSGDYYSATGASVMITTSAQDTVESDVTGITEPAGWFQAPDYTNLSGLGPLYDTINSCADSLDIPRGTFWMLGAIIIAVIAGLLTLWKTHSLIGVILVLLVLMSFGWGVKIIPLWMPGMMIIMGIGFLLVRRQF